MKHRIRYALSMLPAFLLLSITALSKGSEQPAGHGGNPASGGAQAATGMLILKLRAVPSFAPNATATGLAGVDRILARAGARSIAPILSPASALRKGTMSAEESSVARIVKVAYNGGEDPAALARELSLDPAVEYAEPYYIYSMNHTPNDPSYPQQWALAMLKMPEAWDVTTGDSTIVIGSVDSGVDWNHEDLRASIWINQAEWGMNGEKSTNGRDDDANGKIDDWHGWDFIGAGSLQNPQADNNPMDGAIGHGTNTSGCFGARANNGVGIAGTGYRVKILPIKTGAESASLAILAGYDGIAYAIEMGCKIINCSWGGTGGKSQAMQDLIDLAVSRGALVVSSSGNNPLDNDRVPHYPSTLDHVLNVGSVEQSGGVSSWATYGTTVHVCAPGASILTTRRNGGYQSQTGTSFSTPLVSGIAALVFSRHPTWTPDQVLKQIRVTSDAFATPRDPKRYGRVNAFRAVTLNETMTDIPGLLIRSMQMTTPGGNRFTAPGQTAHVILSLQNVLAPTSANAMAQLEFEDAFLTSPTTTFPLGAMTTFGTKTVEFDVTLSGSVSVSEGVLPARLRITDGAHLDFLPFSLEIFMSDAWHTAVGGINLQFFSSIHTKDASTVWATAAVTQNNVPYLDYAFRTSNGGQNWYLGGSSQTGGGFPPSGSGVYCVYALDGQTALAGTGPQNGQARIFRTENGGQAWTSYSVSSMTPFVDAIHMFDSNNGIFIGDPTGGRWGIGTTTDGGATWQAISPPLTAPGSEAGWNNSCDFIGDTGWFGTNNSRIYKTTDRGKTWVSFQTPSMHSTQIAFRNVNTGVARFSRNNSTGTDTLALTTNGGQTWSLISTIAAQASTIAIERSGKRLWLIRGSNVYESTDLGTTWAVQPSPSSMYPITVTSSYTSSANTYVYAAGMNIYSFISPREQVTGVAPPVSRAGDFEILDLYPNPDATGGIVTVRFTIPADAATVIEVVDAAGRSVLQAVNATLRAGPHAAAIDTRELPPGSYFVRMAAASRTTSRHFVVAR